VSSWPENSAAVQAGRRRQGIAAIAWIREAVTNLFAGETARGLLPTGLENSVRIPDRRDSICAPWTPDGRPAVIRMFWMGGFSLQYRIYGGHGNSPEVGCDEEMRFWEFGIW
jgi:hypothetical protein